jgi:uncharacterized protein YbdZ (MbtH family)
MTVDLTQIRYRVIVNNDGQYSLWPLNREGASGWRDTGVFGSSEDCMAYVRHVWSDLRPAHVRAPVEPERPPVATVGQWSARVGSAPDGRLLWRQPLDPRITGALARDGWRRETAADPALADVLANVRLGVVEWADLNDDGLLDQLAQRLRAQAFEPDGPPARVWLARVGTSVELQLSAASSIVDIAAVDQLLPRVAALLSADESVPLELELELADPVPPPPSRQPSVPAEESLVVLRDGDGPHLHLFHPGGGGALSYLALAQLLPAGWRVTASEDIGAGTTTEGLIDQYLPPLLKAYGPPDMVGGWSYGGILAVRAVWMLANTALVLLDPPLWPDLHGIDATSCEIDLEYASVVWHNQNIATHFPSEIDIPADLPCVVAAMQAGALRAGMTLDGGHLLRQIEAYRRHRRALSRYIVPDGLTAPALLVNAANDESTVDWWTARHTPRIDVRSIPCGHLDVLQTPYVEQAAAHVARWWSE